jgi:hypothetical protein
MCDATAGNPAIAEGRGFLMNQPDANGREDLAFGQSHKQPPGKRIHRITLHTRFTSFSPGPARASVRVTPPMCWLQSEHINHILLEPIYRSKVVDSSLQDAIDAAGSPHHVPCRSHVSTWSCWGSLPGSFPCLPRRVYTAWSFPSDAIASQAVREAPRWSREACMYRSGWR